MSRFFLEVLDFKYPKAQLFEYQASIKDWAPNVHYSKKGIDTAADSKWFDYYPDQDNNHLIKEVTENINIKLDGGAYKFVKTLAGGILPFHIDPQRECVLMLPLTDNNAGLQWKIGNTIVCTHIYKGPAVINAKILHGVPTNDKDRLFLQATIPCTWNYLINNYQHIFNI
jgi:hypothetical protein